MADQRANIVLGPAILGKAAFEAQQKANALNTGAIGLGKALSAPFKPNVAAGSEQEVLAPEIDGVQREKAALAGRASVPANARARGNGKNKNVPKEITFSEEDVQKRLAADPNDWADIVKAEAERAEGPRAAVAAMLVSISDKATEKPIPPAILAQLIAVAGITAPAEVPAQE